ncbi:hypothetical protein OIE66_00670 [Nonomuraea sp. NBC_01738]|uniref:hypothetical protein n=1 Tax=Nonomuraea sp. NBC_01738 TaxID=2976003 RepID=UPI002E1057EF|nr:hypothetical protein OIE66_00670 [Nonomuraea sp. NBC_01738]
MTSTVTRASYLAVPLLMLAYGVLRLVDGIDGVRGPGIAWTTGHLAFLAALAGFIPIFLDMRRRIGGGAVATTSAVAGFFGMACAAAQFVIDIVVGLAAADHAAMSAMWIQVKAVPGVDLLVYQGGPILFYAGLLALSIHLAVARKAAFWMPLLVLVQVAAPLVSLDYLPIGALFLLAAFVPLARTAPAARHALAA